MSWENRRYVALGLLRSGAPGPSGIAPYRWWKEGLVWEVTKVSDAFTTGLTSAQTAVTGYATAAIPVVAAVAVAFLGVKYARRIIGKL